MIKTLVIDDEPDILVSCLRHAFPEAADGLRVARSGAEGLTLAQASPPDVVLLDIWLPDMGGLEVFEKLRALDGRCVVVFITGSTMADTAIEAMKQGAFDYLYKPVDLAQLKKVVTEAAELSRLMRVPARVAEPAAPEDPQADAIIGRCAGMREVYKGIGRVAAQDVIVLITGESGTGKELAARAVYQHSRRSGKAFLAINTAAIPEALLESELFGHEKGAFTGADRRRIGKFEQANGGTLFLDEIGDMPLHLQSKILRVLQEQTFERVGGTETIRTDVRVITATHHDLPKLVEAGKFRADLYYRLGVFTLKLPPLRERLDDLPALVGHYVRRFSRDFGRDIEEVDPETLALLHRYPWPGNIRELQSVLKQALLCATGRLLVPAFLPETVRPVVADGEPVGGESVVDAGMLAFFRERLDAGSRDLHAEAIAFVERLLIPMVLERTGGSQSKAAGILGVTRRTLRNRIRDLGLSVPRADAVEDE